MERRPRDNRDEVQTHGACPLNDSLKTRCLRILYGSVVSITKNDILVRIRSKLFLLKFMIFLKYLLRKVLGSMFSIKCFTFFLFHIHTIDFLFCYIDFKTRV